MDGRERHYTEREQAGGGAGEVEAETPPDKRHFQTSSRWLA